MPLFIFAANLLNATGVTSHLFELVRLLVGRIRGGVAQVSVLVSLIFSGISGAALADIGALGAIQITDDGEQGYKDEFAAGVTMAAATIGPIFPPSIPIIIFAAAANVSAVKLLLAGIVPALVIAVLLMLQIAIMARLKGLPRDTMRPTCARSRAKFVISLPALLGPGASDRRADERLFRADRGGRRHRRLRPADRRLRLPRADLAQFLRGGGARRSRRPRACCSSSPPPRSSPGS